MIDFDGIAQDLLARSESFCRELLPAGKREGHEWRVGNIHGEAGHSLSINLSTGVWKDWGGADAGADLISLFAAVRGLTQAQAARELRPEPIRANGNGHHAPAPPFIPPPPRVPDAAALYRYTDTHYIARFEPPGKAKSFRPYTWNGSTWNVKAHEKPRPLFGLDDLAARPDAPVMVVEGEKCALAAGALLQRYVVMSWAGGAASVGTADWSALYGRWVDIWPDADDPGRAAAEKIAVLLAPRCTTVRIVDQSDRNDGWDLADAVAEGMDAAAVLALGKARIRVVDKPATTADVEDLVSAAGPGPSEEEVQAALAEMDQALQRDQGEPEQIVADSGTAHPMIIRAGERGAAAASDITNTDIANGRRFVQRWGPVIRYTPEQEWLIWDGRRWAPDSRAVSAQAMAKRTAMCIYDEAKDSLEPSDVFKHAKASMSRKGVESMLFMARSEPGVLAHLTDFDTDAWLLNLSNGTLDLRSGTLRTHAQVDRITRLVPIEFDPEARAPRWERFLGEVTGESVDLINYLQRVVGYCLTGTTGEQVLHFLYGVGANGKSVFSEVLAALLGDYAMIASSEMIMSKRSSGIPNDVARLRGMRLALMNETSQGASFDEQKLKDLTGSDSLTGRFMRAEFFDFKPTHKLIIRGNHKPTIAGTDDGIWRRLRLVPFTVQIPDEERDQSLLATLTLELPGILNWAIAGCLEWQRVGLKPPESVRSAVGEYREESDVLGRFISECCEVRKLGQVTTSAFYKRYVEFAKESGERWVQAKEVPHEMRRRGFEWKKTNSANIFLGIEIKQEDERLY